MLNLKDIIMHRAYFIFFLFLFNYANSYSQELDSKTNTFNSLDKALMNPLEVKRLDLSNQQLNLSTVDFSLFKNLEYLSLKNDHLTEFPDKILELENLRILDLSGNDFRSLPNSLDRLNKLEEVYLNDEKELNMPSAIRSLSTLPNLKYLHLEGDRLKEVPKEIVELKKLEKLYINDNKIKEVPDFVNDMKRLNYIDLQHNMLAPTFKKDYSPEGNMKVKF